MRGLRWLSISALLLALFVGLGTAYAQQNTGKICVLAFEDQNGNSARDNDEPLLANVGFTLADTSGVKASYKTDGNSEPYCFGGLAPAQYTVQARGNTSLEATTPGQWAVSLAAGATFTAEYGATKTGGNAASDTGSQTTAGSGGSFNFGRVVLGLAGVVVLGLAGFLAVTTLRRARNQR